MRNCVTTIVSTLSVFINSHYYEYVYYSMYSNNIQEERFKVLSLPVHKYCNMFCEDNNMLHLKKNEIKQSRKKRQKETS